MLISEAFQSYTDDVIIFRNQSRSTEDGYLHTCKLLVSFAGDLDVEQLSFEQIRDWKRQLGKRLELSSVRGYIISLRMVLKYLSKRGYKVVDWELITVPKRPAKIVEFLTEEQVSQLLTVMGRPARGYPCIARLRNCAIISLLYASGIRATELRNLDRANLRPDNSFTVIGKGSKARLCFFDDRSRLYIDQYLKARTDTNTALFIADQTGRRLSKSGLQIIFDRARRLVDFPIALHAHTLRHSYATNLLRNNANMRYVQALLGHSDIATTQMYTHVVDEDLRAIYEQHHTC